MPSGRRQVTRRQSAVQGAIGRGTRSTPSRTVASPVTQEKPCTKNAPRESSVEKTNQPTKQKLETEKEKKIIPKEAWLSRPATVHVTQNLEVKEEKSETESSLLPRGRRRRLKNEKINEQALDEAPKSAQATRTGTVNTKKKVNAEPNEDGSPHTSAARGRRKGLDRKPGIHTSGHPKKIEEKYIKRRPIMRQQQTPTVTEQMRQIHKKNISIETSTTPKDIEKKDVSVSLSASQEVSQHAIKRELDATYSKVASLDRGDVMVKSSFINDVLEKEIISKIVEIDKRFSFEIIHAGSYYEGLKVGEADEFDIMVKLNADKISKIFKINVCPARRHSDLVGFAYLEYQSHFDSDRNWRDLLMEGPNNRLVLSPELILKRFESLLSQRLHKMNSLKKRHWKESPVLTLHGPAVKITFRLFNGKPLDTDVVLCLESAEWPLVANSWGTLHLPKWPSEDQVNKIKKKGCHVVPKVHSSDDRCWRLSFSVAEKSLLYPKAIDEDKKYYRIVKLIFERYKDKLEPLCSYHLKTLLLHIRTNCPPMSGDIEVVEYFIEQLIEKVRTRALPHYFIGHTLNLFNEMSDTQASEIINCFTKTFGDRTTIMKLVKNFGR